MDASARRRLRVEDLGVADSLVKLSNLVQDVVAQVAAAHDLTPQQARLLVLLRDREPGMARLAQLIRLDRSSTTGLVTRVERLGLLARVPDPDDGRAVRVVLTARGKQLAVAVNDRIEQQVGRLADGLAETNRGRLSLLASQIVHLYAQENGVDISTTTPDPADASTATVQPEPLPRPEAPDDRPDP